VTQGFKEIKATRELETKEILAFRVVKETQENRATLENKADLVGFLENGISILVPMRKLTMILVVVMFDLTVPLQVR
jgi:hypothetical protein